MNFTYLLILAMVIWGVSWASAKQISGYSPPEVLIFWRNLATFIFLFPFLFILKQKVKFSKKIFLNSLFGAILMSTYNYLFFAGLKNGLAGAGGVLVTTLNPILNFILVSILYHHVWKKREIIGLIMGFSGGLIIIRIWEIKPEDIYKSGNLFFLIASLMWAFLSIQTHRAKKYMEPIPYSFLVYGFSTIITFFFAFFYDWTAPIGFDLKFWINLIYLSGISTAFATTIYFIASSHLGSHVASSFIFIVPASAAISSWIIIGEKPLLSTFIGGVLALLAAKIIQPPKPKNLSEDKSENEKVEKSI